jgi:hypothetical protein
MRIGALLLLCAALLAPGSAAADGGLTPENAAAFQAAMEAHPAECSRLARQIDHYEGMAERARQMGNDMWRGRTQNHVDMLRGIQAARCPDDVPVDTTAEAFKHLITLAAKAALTYFTFGAAGF